MSEPEPTPWDELADWYDRRQGESGDLWHRALIDPALLQRLGEVSGLDVLDLGCGNGYLTRRLRRAGARTTGIDRSERMIAAALRREEREPLGIRYFASDAGNLRVLDEASFDRVVSNMVLMDLPDAEGAISEVARLLRPFGRFVASFDHPCFGGDAGARWEPAGRSGARAPARTVHAYREVLPDPSAWNGPDGRTMLTEAFHRPLSWYADRLRTAGMAITALDEPSPTAEFREESPLAEAIEAIPLHVVLEAVRLPSPDPGGRR